MTANASSATGLCPPGGAREWLREQGYDPDEILPESYDDCRRTTAESNLVTRDVALREWMKFHGSRPRRTG